MTRTYTYGTQSHITFAAYLGLFLLLTLGVAFNAMAAESAGRLLFARGDVQISATDAQPRMAARGDMLYVGDTVTTGIASNAQLRMSDGAMIALKSDTVFRIEEQQYNPKKPGEGSQVGELLRGGMRAVTGAIGHEKPSAVSFRTPVATIGIRGTVFDTIYVPPEGLPGLPGVAPGTYTLVLEGQVLLSSGGGELLLGVGEIGYVPFEGAPPELRPDLESLFVQYASYVEKLLQKGGKGVPGYIRTAFSSFDSDEVFTLFADYVSEQFLPPPPSGTPNATVTQGPYGIANVVSTAQVITPYQGDFFSSPVTVGGTYGDMQNATGGTGGIAGYQFPAAFQPVPMNTGSATVGNSTINWGQFGGLDIQLTDQNNQSIPVGSTDFINYINATNVIISTADLPTIGSYTYNYVGGSGQQLLSGSNLQVNFGTATMDVTLIAEVFGVGGPVGTYTANNQAISTFYGNGISLDGNVGGTPVGTASSISGRFVGSQAEGAIAGFLLDAGDGFVAGTAAFAR